MTTTLEPRVVVVTRSTEYEELLARHGTRGQAAFFLETRGLAIEEVEERHHRFMAAFHTVMAAIPGSWSRARLERRDLDRFVFEPRDVLVALGQDGLVANMAKYLMGQPVVGINPDPRRYDGVLVPHAPERAEELFALCGENRVSATHLTMAQAVVDGSQRLLALNEIFVGHRTHQSARYRIAFRGEEERQSSSGLIVATGTGSTGWARSIARQRNARVSLPDPDQPRLVFFVREAFPSVATGTALTEGRIRPGEALEVISEMNESGVIFADGIESDRLDFTWGRKVEIGKADVRLNLVRG